MKLRYVLSAGALAGGAYLAARRRLAPPPAALHPVLAGAPLLVAHRGGAGLAPENTLEACRRADAWWRADMVELDVHASADGHCVVIHDPIVERTTDGAGAVAEMTLAELRALDAGYRFTRDGGATFPFRGQGLTIPTLDEVLEALPRMRLIVEVKAGGAQRPFMDAVRRHDAVDRVVAAGMYERDRTHFGAWTGAVSASTEQVRRFLAAHWCRAGVLASPAVHVVQVPEYHGRLRIVTARFVEELHRRGIQVHVWTVNEEAAMRRLLAWGVDGLITDRPDVAAALLGELHGRPAPPGPPPGED
ncbi:MAG: glycerophosphodiester phosphodiesterase [Gemmatimonadota bacterium]